MCMGIDPYFTLEQDPDYHKPQFGSLVFMIVLLVIGLIFG